MNKRNSDVIRVVLTFAISGLLVTLSDESEDLPLIEIKFEMLNLWYFLIGPIDVSKSEWFEGSGLGSSSEDIVEISLDEGSGEGSGGFEEESAPLGLVERTLEIEYEMVSEADFISKESSTNIDDLDVHTTVAPLNLDLQSNFVNLSTTIHHFLVENFTTIAPVILGTSDDYDPSFLAFTTERTIETLEIPTTESSFNVTTQPAMPVFDVMYHASSEGLMADTVHEVTYHHPKSSNKKSHKKQEKPAPKAGKANRKRGRNSKKHQRFETTIDPFTVTDVPTTPKESVELEVVTYQFNVTDVLETTMGPI